MEYTDYEDLFNAHQHEVHGTQINVQCTFDRPWSTHEVHGIQLNIQCTFDRPWSMQIMRIYSLKISPWKCTHLIMRNVSATHLNHECLHSSCHMELFSAHLTSS